MTKNGCRHVVPRGQDRRLKERRDTAWPLIKLLQLVSILFAWHSFVYAEGQPSVNREQSYAEARAYLLTPECTQKDAISKFTAVIKADPSHPENDMVLLVIANLLCNGDTRHGWADPVSALRVCDVIIQKYPATRRPVLRAHIMIGDIHLASGQRAEARKAYGYVVSIDTSAPEWQEVRPWLKEQADGLAPVLAATAVVPGFPSNPEGSPEAPPPEQLPPASSMPPDTSQSPKTSRDEPIPSVDDHEEAQYRARIGIALIAVGLIAGLLGVVACLAGPHSSRNEGKEPGGA